MSKKLAIIPAVFSVLALVVLALNIDAVTGGTLSRMLSRSLVAATISNPLGFGTVTSFLQHIHTSLIKIAVPLSAVMIIWGGFQWMTAGANPEGVTAARKTITYALIGLAVVLLAQWIIAVVKNILGV